MEAGIVFLFREGVSRSNSEILELFARISEAGDGELGMYWMGRCYEKLGGSKNAVYLYVASRLWQITAISAKTPDRQRPHFRNPAALK